MYDIKKSEIILMDDVEVELIDYMGDDAAIVQAARVSTQGENEAAIPEWALSLPDAGLIGYLMREKHGSPFEHTSLKFYVKGPIFAFREFQRHRMASYNEMSGRYRELPAEFYIPNEHRPLINVGKPSKPEFAPGSPEQFELMSDSMMQVYELAWLKYKLMLQAGIANEVARMVLPVGIMSQMYVTMNLRALFNFLSLRTQRENARHVSRPQIEIEMIADKMEQMASGLFPVAFEKFELSGRVAP